MDSAPVKKEKTLCDVGIVETLFHTFADPPHELHLECGDKIGPVTLAYETYGTLNADRSNAILVCHALSGDAHAAGIHAGEENPGWWNDMIGPGKGFDTSKYFVICSNIVGGCRGSTGPSSIHPGTGRPYALEFPFITIADMVNAQRCLIDHLGIEKLLCVTGGSMGGAVGGILPGAGTCRHSHRHDPEAFSPADRLQRSGAPVHYCRSFLARGELL